MSFEVYAEQFHKALQAVPHAVRRLAAQQILGQTSVPKSAFEVTVVRVTDPLGIPYKERRVLYHPATALARAAIMQRAGTHQEYTERLEEFHASLGASGFSANFPQTVLNDRFEEHGWSVMMVDALSVVLNEIDATTRSGREQLATLLMEGRLPPPAPARDSFGPARI